MKVDVKVILATDSVTFVFNLLKTMFLTTSLSTTSLSFVKLIGIVFDSSTSTLVFKLFE